LLFVFPYFLSNNLLTQWNEACNLGQVYGNMTDQLIASLDACSALGNGPDPSGVFDCDCCQTSQVFSNIFNICPSSNLSSIGFDSWFATQEKLIKSDQVSYSEIASMAGGGPLGNCTILNTAPDTCASKYKLPIEGTKWWNPLALPAGVPGTQALSDVAGSVTVPPWGTTKTTMVLFPSYTTVITPAAYNEENAAATTGVSGTTTAAGATAGTGTGSAGAAVTTTKASAASELVLRSWGASLIVMAVSGLLCF
jgi:hypothetical protein